ncbi:hypothetical protein [Streptomyces ochraceiscleroticus]|uniref:Ricin B lectin domain-containing protein n=1 Tax=Streptomyces ochraceiscleroticus TaxID=47761 RepID=A0ABW1MK75_9ACTN|nr:hypothetical protein [Streptomyces ochraceiscleroticus]
MRFPKTRTALLVAGGGLLSIALVTSTATAAPQREAVHTPDVSLAEGGFPNGQFTIQSIGSRGDCLSGSYRLERCAKPASKDQQWQTAGYSLGGQMLRNLETGQCITFAPVGDGKGHYPLRHSVCNQNLARGFALDSQKLATPYKTGEYDNYACLYSRDDGWAEATRSCRQSGPELKWRVGAT